MQALGVLLRFKLKEAPNVIVVILDDKNYLEAIEKQCKSLIPQAEFFGILYSPPLEEVRGISPEEYFHFWQNFATKLKAVKRKEMDLKTDNPYDQ